MRLKQYTKNRATILLMTSVVLIPLLSGCIGRQQALLTTQKLTLSSEQAVGIVKQAKENETQAVKTHRELREAYRQLFMKTWQSLLELQRRSLEVEYKNAVAELEAEHARLLAENQKQRKTTLKTVDSKLNEVLTEVFCSEAAAEAKALEARKKAKDAPRDLPLLQASLEADVEYFALAAQSREIELNARKSIQNEIISTDTLFQERLNAATKKHRENLLKAFSAAKGELTNAEMPELDLGAEPETNQVFYDSLVQYLTSVQKAGTSLTDYLESNGFGTNSLLMAYLRSASSGLVNGVFQPIANLKDGFATLSESAKGLGQEYLAEMKDAGKEAKDTLSTETRDITTNLLEDILNRVTTVVNEAASSADS